MLLSRAGPVGADYQKRWGCLCTVVGLTTMSGVTPSDAAAEAVAAGCVTGRAKWSSG